MTEAIVVHQQYDELSTQQLVARKHKIREVMERVMKKDVHYGIVPGTKKASLWQPGAETLFVTFQLSPDVRAVEDLSTGDAIRYRVTIDVRHIGSGEIVGCGIGEASSDEEKYRWREALCDEEFEETPVDRRRRKWKKDWSGPRSKRVMSIVTVNQIRTEPADIANTVLKMATKRARVDAAKSTCAASDVFDQDLEDLAAAGVELSDDGPGDQVATPKAKPANGAATAPTPTGDVATIGFASEAWQRAIDGWHDKGAISDKQLKRLFAIAMGKGWSAEKVKAVIDAALGVEPEQIPWGDSYNAVVEIFEAHAPDAAQASAPKPPTQPPRRDDEPPPVTDQDIPF